MFAGNGDPKFFGKGVLPWKSQSFVYLHPTFDGLTPHHKMAETTTLELTESFGPSAEFAGTKV
jgi:hypothetical protein